MTNKSLGNQTSGGLQGVETAEPEYKDTTPQQCGWVSHNMLLALTVLGVSMLCLCTFVRMLVEYAIKFIIWGSSDVTLMESFR